MFFVVYYFVVIELLLSYSVSRIFIFSLPVIIFIAKILCFCYNIINGEVNLEEMVVRIDGGVWNLNDCPCGGRTDIDAVVGW